MSIRQIMLDVDKALERPSIIEIANAIEAQNGVEGLSIVANGNIHSPNEKLDILNFVTGIETVTYFHHFFFNDKIY